MNMAQAVVAYYKNYANFSGRASRPEYWWSALYRGVIFVGLLMWLSSSSASITSAIALLAFMVIHTVPDISITVRRLHDSDKTGWMFFLVFAPFGGLIIFVLMLQPSSEWKNQWGLPPGTPAELLPG